MRCFLHVSALSAAVYGKRDDLKFAEVVEKKAFEDETLHRESMLFEYRDTPDPYSRLSARKRLNFVWIFFEFSERSKILRQRVMEIRNSVF